MKNVLGISLLLFVLATFSCYSSVKYQNLPPQKIYDYLVGIPRDGGDIITYVYHNLDVKLETNQYLLPKDGSVTAALHDGLDLVFEATAGTFEKDSSSPLAGASRYSYVFFVTETGTNFILNCKMKLDAGLYRDPDTLHEDSYMTMLSASFEPDEDGYPSEDIILELYEDTLWEISAYMEDDPVWRIPR